MGRLGEGYGTELSYAKFMKAMSSGCANKAGGLSGMTLEVLRQMPPTTQKMIFDMLQKYMDTKEVERSPWNEFCLTFVKKAAKIKEAKDIRGIILLEPLQQLLMASIPKTNNHGHETYDERIGIVGFRARRSCFHCLAQPVVALRTAKAWQFNKIVVGVTDIVGAFEGVTVQLLIEAMTWAGIEDAEIHACVREHRLGQAVCRVPQLGTAPAFAVGSAGRPGSKLFPQLFNICIAYILDGVTRDWETRGMIPSYGHRNEEVKRYQPIITWADNIIFMATNIKDMTEMLEEAQKALKKYNLYYKAEDSVILEEGKEEGHVDIGDNEEERLRFDFVKSWKALGVQVGNEGSTENMVEARMAIVRKYLAAHLQHLKNI